MGANLQPLVEDLVGHSRQTQRGWGGAHLRPATWTTAQCDEGDGRPELRGSTLPRSRNPKEERVVWVRVGGKRTKNRPPQASLG